ncbi:MFS transporter [Pelagicoccus albus]|uniref:MFS transporter n=1 Tax=Pelagicoccus albus TaxID=415222 RepID=A0A7X1E7M2_9BACT|nr:MFS transporter [Pelagicoccus albus]MBC2605900.1 MFS transporter [Pelagicoccus albus]
MNSLKFQYFFLYGSFAAVQPFVALLFKERGMDEEQMGYAMGMAGWAIMLSPAVVTALADLHLSPRRLLAALCLITGGALTALLSFSGNWPLVIGFFVYSLGVTAVLPLLDGIFFGVQRMQGERGEPETHYNKVRVWGTFGYMVLLLALFYPMERVGEVALALWFGVGCFAILFLLSFLLPDRGRREAKKAAEGLPTSKALLVLFNRENILFSAAMFLLLSCSAAYHTMYPVFLAEDLELETHWVGIVIMSGTIIEVFCILGLTRLEDRWGLRVVMLGAIFLTLVRFGLMYAYPNLTVAVGTQVFHGAMICAMLVVPPNYLNGLADDSNRNSIQGVYTMLIIGLSKFVGTAISGHVAAVDQRYVHLLCLLLTAASLVCLWYGFRPRQESDLSSRI